MVHEFVGHGTGQLMHMLPYVQHHVNDDKLDLVPGMVFTIEPILVEGRREVVMWPDQWTILTADGSRYPSLYRHFLPRYTLLVSQLLFIRYRCWYFY